MGFLEKLKNTFFEEEYVEVDEPVKVVKKEVKQEVKKVKEVPVQREAEEEVQPVRKEIERNEQEEIRRVAIQEEMYEDTSSKREVNRREKFNYFDDDDFLDMNEDFYERPREKVVAPVKKEQVSKPVYQNPSYGTKKPTNSSSVNTSTVPTSQKAYSREEKTAFKPTPIISPIYGILDKNYTKDEIVDKKEIRPSSSYVSKKNVDLDSVREKAYGSMVNDFGLTDYTKTEKTKIEVTDFEEDDDMADDNLLYDMTDISKTPTVDKVTLQDAEEYFQDLGLEYNVDYKDARLERVTGRRVAKTPKLEEIEDVEEDIFEVKDEDDDMDMFFPKEEISNKKKEFEDNENLEDNLFDLIDSMYEEKE